jgi:RNA polymerase-binding protein DksA
MTKKQTEEFRQKLVALAQRVRGDVSDLRDDALRGTGGDASGNLSNIPLHLADLGTDTFEQEMAVGMLQNEHQLLLAIDAALDRVDAGSYGTCGRCGKDIPLQRLEAVPYAALCVDCQQQSEQGAG